MHDQLTALLAKATAELAGCNRGLTSKRPRPASSEPNGELTALMKQMGAVPKEQRPALASSSTRPRPSSNRLLDDALRRIANAEIAAQIGASIDPTLPSPDRRPGHTASPYARARGNVPDPAQGRFRRR